MAKIKRICSIPGCGKRHKALGWCVPHYRRHLRYGDPVGGGTPNGEPLKFFREVVLPYEGNKCLKWPYSNVRGYGEVTIDGKHRLVTRLACEERNGPPPTPDHEAAHSCGNGHKRCCTKRHLSWKTHAENMADMVAHGTSLRGENNPRAKITVAGAARVRELKGIMSQRAIAVKFRISQQQVSNIHVGKSWPENA